MIKKIPVHSRADWLAVRKRDCTASDVGALFGVHPYRTALQVFADKTGEGIDRGDNAAMRRGRILEPGVAAAVAEERPRWSLEKVKEYWSDEDLRLGATPDFSVIDHAHPERGMGIIETKTADPQIFERDWKQGVPLAWTLQCLTQMMLGGASWGAIAVLVVSRDFPVFIYDIERHPAAEAKIIDKVKAFWDAVESGTAPPADFARDGDAIQAMFRRDNGEAIDLSLDNRMPEVLERRAELAATIRAAEAEKEALDAEIKQKLGEASTATLRGWRITWKTQHREKFTVQAKDIRVLRIADLRAKQEAAA